MKKILFYTNQFFGQIGGEEFAYQEPFVEDGIRGNANAFAPKIEGGEIVATIVCGDNYFVENMDVCKDFIKKQVEKYQPDILMAGPAFNAGRFGIACCEVCKLVQGTYNIPSITGLYWENPGVEMYKADCYIMEVGKSAATIRKAVPLITGFVNKIIAGEKLGTPKQEHYYPKGQRVNVFHEKNGAERAVDMLIKKVNGEEYDTELEISVYEKVEPSAPLADLKKAKIALCTTGGIVPMGNPDHMFAATAKFWKKYDLAGKTGLEKGEFESVHAGFDPVYANDNPNRVAPYSVLKKLEAEGEIGEVYPYLLTTTGNSTSVADATRMGQEMAEDLLAAGVDGVILTST
ncbi:betaine reductase [Clostridiales Family XIII bacterium PM5-7]